MSACEGISARLIQGLDRLLDLGARGVAGMQGGAFHHVGIAVPSIRETWEGLARLIGAEPDSPVLADPIQKVSALFLMQASSGRRIELIEPIGDESPISRFLQKSGGGPHHLCFETPHFEQDLQRLRLDGARLVCPPVEACGFHGAKIAFCYTRDRVLVEFVEAPVRYDRVVHAGSGGG